MAQPKFKAYAVVSLPTTGIDTGGIYYVRQGSTNTFNLYIRNNANSDWLSLGTTEPKADSVNDLTGDVKVDLVFTNGVLEITATGTGTQWATTSIDLDSRYSQLAHTHVISDITGLQTALNDKANDSTVVHKAGTETITGDKTFSVSPKGPVPTQSTQLANKQYVDDEVSAVQNIVDQIVGSGVIIVDEIDASTNPNFPVNPSGTKKGNAWIVTTAGKIGGASGRQVDVGNMIIAKVDDASPGTYATSSNDWVIVQSDLDQATEIVKGFARIATQAEVDTGTDDSTIVTPKKLKTLLDNISLTNDDRYVRHDSAAQGLTTTEKSNARTNIDAASDSDVVKLTGTQSIGGTKTFTSSPVVPNAAANNEAVNLGQLNTITEGKFVRFDSGSQGLTTQQQTNARTNISAASEEDVKWSTKDW